jgi:hypothetical protein
MTNGQFLDAEEEEEKEEEKQEDEQMKQVQKRNKITADEQSPEETLGMAKVSLPPEQQATVKGGWQFDDVNDEDDSM